MIAPPILQAIQNIPRQFYADNNKINQDSPKNANDTLTSLFISRYRRLTGTMPRSPQILPTSSIIQDILKNMPEQKGKSLSDMINYISGNMPVSSSPTQTILFENTEPGSSTKQNMILELRADIKISWSKFDWDFFKLNLFVEQYGYTNGFYLLVNQQAEAVRKKIEDYYSQNLYSSYNAGNIYFILKKDYDSEIVILDANGGEVKL